MLLTAPNRRRGPVASRLRREVDPFDRTANRDPKPLKALDHYDHGAVVVDPRRGDDPTKG